MATRTPRPTNTPRPDPTDTPVPTPTPTLGPPRIDSIDPPSATCDARLTVRGQNFGRSRDAVNGHVRVSGIRAEIDAWSNEQISVVVPRSVRPGNHGTVEVVVNDRIARLDDVRVNC